MSQPIAYKAHWIFWQIFDLYSFEKQRLVLAPEQYICNSADKGYSEWPEDHKSFNFIELENGQYAAQPNNRTIFLDAASNPSELSFPDFNVCTKKYVVETNPKWFLGDTSTVMYERRKDE